jgi:hypothetical protein
MLHCGPDHSTPLKPREGAALPKLIDDVLLLGDCSDTEEWANQVIYLPLR